MPGWLQRTVAIASMCLVYGSAQALPVLQIGPGTVGDWTYDTITETWVTTSNIFELETLANTNLAGGSGQYAWDGAGGLAQYAYLVVAATPKAADATDLFNVSLTNDSSALSMVSWGFGNPPLEDTNSMAPHGIYDTYFEIYEFQFDRSPVEIGNTEPGDSSTAIGHSETIGVEILSLSALGLHFDLFTLTDSGKFSDITELTKDVLKANAPYSHDAEYNVVPVPAAFWLFGTALLGFIGFSRRRLV